MELAALCTDAGVASRVSGATAGVDVVDIAYRSERCGPGSLFCCLPGGNADGHDFAPAAVANGAVALLVERELPDLGVPQILCDDAREGMARLAASLYGHPSRELDTVGVTGTNGKTTTTLLLAAMLDAAQRPCGLLGTVERRIGGRREAAGLTTPEAPDLQRSLRSMIEAGDEACAMEASSIAIAQRRLVATEFAAVGFTNLSQDHLDFHRDLEDYFAAKASLFDGRFPRVVNADDAYGARLEAELRFGVESPSADVRCEAYELRPDRTELFVRTPQGALSLEPRLRGRFNIDNVLCAVTLALLLEVPLGAIEHAVAATGAPPGRFEPVETGQGFGVIVDYAHTPAGIAAVLASARPLTGGRLLCVFGAGGDRDHAKRPLMGAAAEAGADRLYVTSDNSRSESTDAIVAQILEGLEHASEALVEHDRRRAIARALADAGEGDLVLILGKGHEQGQDIGGVVEPFDDRTVAQELLGVIPLAAGDLEGTRLLSGDPSTRIESIVSDSRAAGPGALFCALEGERVDGHDFLEAVAAAGAVAVLCRTGRSRPLQGVCVLEADEPLTALGAIARQVRRAWGGKVIGIAGSNGKTSTKDMLAALCAPHVPTLATHRNHNNRLGLPLTLFRLERGHALCICELGTSEIGELADLAAIAEPEIGMVTNIAPEHLEFLGDLEGVAREEAALLDALPAHGEAVVPAHEPLLAPYLRDDLRATTFGEPGGDVRCLAWEPGADGTRALLDVLGERVELTVPLRAPHHADNLAAAAAAYVRAGLPLAGLPEGAAAIELSPFRGQELARDGGGVLVNDAYNANPVSVESALAALVERAEGARTVAVLGTMAELGPDAPRWHAEAGHACARLGIDVVIGVGELAAGYATAAEGCEWHWAADVPEAADLLPRVLRPGDVVLLKGSRSAGIERLAEAAL